MRLIIHLGFHKTASTHLQHLLNGNAGALADRGIWYQHQAGYPAHHFAAWALMLGDAIQLEVMIRNAAAHNCHSVILSSEDLEAVPFNPQITALIEITAARLGVTEIEWHIVLREPGAYFSSLLAQLQHHVYGDSLVMLTEVMRKGMLFIADPLAGAAGTPYWFYCFDHYRHIAALAANTQHPVIVHDYADADPYPGWRLLDRPGALDAIVALPDGEDMNRRLASPGRRLGLPSTRRRGARRPSRFLGGGRSVSESEYGGGTRVRRCRRRAVRG